MARRGLLRLLKAVPARFMRESGGESVPGAESVASGESKRQQAPRLSDLVRQLPSALRDTALTHSSWVDDRASSYERLEFLGDSVLGLAVASALYQRFPQATEGELARLKAFVVSRASCAQAAARLGVAVWLEERAERLGVEADAIRDNPTLRGNVLEALIGAVFLTYGFEQTRQAVIEEFAPQIEYALTAHIDHKTALQELLAAQGLQPVYRLVREDGPPHARLFTSQVLIEGAVWGEGTGRTIKGSEQTAAREALTALGGRAVEGSQRGDSQPKTLNSGGSGD